MSLNWNLSRIEDHDDLFVENDDGTVELDGLTHSFIFTAMVTGLGKNWSLDEEFAPEFYARLKLLEKLNGPLVTRGGEPYSVTFEDVKRRIGLEVNVSPVTRAQFLKNAVAVDLDRDVRRYKETTKEAQNV